MEKKFNLFLGYFVGPQFTMRKFKAFATPEYHSSLPSSPSKFGFRRLLIGIAYLTGGSIYLFLSIYLSLYLSIHLLRYLSIHLYIYPSIHLSIHMIYSSIHLFIHPSIFLYIYLSRSRVVLAMFYLSSNLFIYLSYYPSIELSLHPSL